MRASIPNPNQHKLLRRGNILNGYITYKIYLCNLIHPRAGKLYLNQRVSKSHQACHVHCYDSSNYGARDTPSLSSASMIKYMYDYDNQWKIHTTTNLLTIYKANHIPELWVWVEFSTIQFWTGIPRTHRRNLPCPARPMLRSTEIGIIKKTLWDSLLLNMFSQLLHCRNDVT